MQVKANTVAERLFAKHRDYLDCRRDLEMRMQVIIPQHQQHFGAVWRTNDLETDWMDNALIIDHVMKPWMINPEQLRKIFELGFEKVYIAYLGGSICKYEKDKQALYRHDLFDPYESIQNFRESWLESCM